MLKGGMEGQEVFWANPGHCSAETAFQYIDLSCINVADARARLERFAPFIETMFPETRADKGIIESPLRQIPGVTGALGIGPWKQ